MEVKPEKRADRNEATKDSLRSIYDTVDQLLSPRPPKGKKKEPGASWEVVIDYTTEPRYLGGVAMNERTYEARSDAGDAIVFTLRYRGKDLVTRLTVRETTSSGQSVKEAEYVVDMITGEVVIVVSDPDQQDTLDDALSTVQSVLEKLSRPEFKKVIQPLTDATH